MADLEEIRKILHNSNFLTEIQKVGLDAIPILLELVGTPIETDIQINALKSLYHLDQDLAIQPLIEALFSPDLIIRSIASAGLKTIGIQAIEPLMKLLSKPYQEIPLIIFEIIAEIGELSSVEPLIELLKDTQNSDILQAVISCLGKIGDMRAAIPIKEYLTSSDPKLRYQAVNALTNLMDLTALDSFYALMHTDQDIQLRTWYAYFLIKVSKHYLDKAVDTLFHFASKKPLSDEELWDQMNAIEKIGWIDDPRKVQFLIDSLGNSHNDIQALAIQSLGVIGDSKAVPSLIECTRDISPEIRMYSTEALGNINDKRAVKPLIERLRDSDLEVQKQAISSLGHIGDKQALPHLLQLREQPLDDEASFMLEVSLRILGYS